MERRQWPRATLSSGLTQMPDSSGPRWFRTSMEAWSFVETDSAGELLSLPLPVRPFE